MGKIGKTIRNDNFINNIDFSLCNVPNVKSPSDLGYLMNTLAEVRGSSLFIASFYRSHYPFLF